MTVYTAQTCDELDDYLARSHRALVMLRTVSRPIEARGDENQIEFDSSGCTPLSAPNQSRCSKLMCSAPRD
jgi:hypothetical protein